MSGPDVVVVLGGDPGPFARRTPIVPAGAAVVAADSGLDLALAAGIAVDHVVGDLDSVTPGALAIAEAAGAVVHRHPPDKDATDGELAIGLALELLGVRPVDDAGTDGGARPQLLVIGGGGGRLDHLLADLLGLAGPTLAAVEVTGRFGSATATVVRPGRPRRIPGAVGEQVSLLPVHGRARGVTTTGLRWALVDADLVPGTTRAVSNELTGVEGTVSIAEGVVLVIQPGAEAAPVAARTTAYDPTPVDPLG